MPTYVLDVVERTSSTQKVAAVEDLDGAVVTNVQTVTLNGRRNLRLTYTTAQNISMTTDVPYVHPDDRHYPLYITPAQVGGSANSITLSPNPALTGLMTGDLFIFRAKSTSTGSVSVNVSGRGATQLHWRTGRAGGSGARIVQGNYYEILYVEGSPNQFVIVGTSLGDSTAKAVGTSSGDIPALGSGGLLDKDRIPNLQNLNGTVPVSKGGTGATTAANARSGLGLGTAAVLDSGSSQGDVPTLGSNGRMAVGQVPDLTALQGTVAVTQGGTGATTAAAARTNLGLGTSATRNTGTAENDVPILDSSGKLDTDVLPGVTEDLGGITKPSVSSETQYSINVASDGAVTLGSVLPEQLMARAMVLHRFTETLTIAAASGAGTAYVGFDYTRVPFWVNSGATTCHMAIRGAHPLYIDSGLPAGVASVAVTFDFNFPDSSRSIHTATSSDAKVFTVDVAPAQARGYSVAVVYSGASSGGTVDFDFDYLVVRDTAW